jgi:PASTA domain
VSCPSEEFCLALTPTGGVIYEKGSWGKPFVIDSHANGNDLRSVSCISRSYCFAVGVQGKVFSYNGAVWTGPLHVAHERELNSVSCFSTSFCVAGGQEGYVAVYNGSSWSSSATSVDPGQFIASLSCGAQGFCAAGDNSGGVLTYRGGAWSSRLHLPGLVLTYHVLVSCPSASFCAGVSSDGHGSTFNGTSWSTPLIVDRDVPLALSCPSASFCLAADAGGNYFTYSGEAHPPRCHVPKLRGKTLAQARKLLSKDHCKLGRVTESRKHSKHRVVLSQRPGAGKTLPAGAKVAVKLS